MDTRFPWDTLRAVIGGRSALDVPRVHARTPELAEQFLDGYGFDVRNPAHLAEIEDLRQEAIAFLETQLLDDDEAILPEVRAQTDPRQLLVWASAAAPNPTQGWSCAILRVAHTLAHSRSYFNEKYGHEIRNQIFARFEPHLFEDDTGLRLGAGPDAIALKDFEVKPGKPVFSVAMKLLHKVENVAEDIFDRIGVRFITHERFDALLVVRYLRERNVFMFANIKPSRSRNTLLDLGWLEDFMAGLDAEVAAGHIAEEERIALLREAVATQPYPAEPSHANAYTSASYHSLQFTCRQMIRVRDESDQEIRFFFPFEIQVLDEDSYQRSRSGYAAHDLYKERQRQAVRRRVLGHLLH